MGSESGQKPRESEELAVERLSSLTLDGIVLVSLFSGIDTLPRL